MPKVGNKHFPYTKKGRLAAKVEKKRMMQTSDGYSKVKK